MKKVFEHFCWETAVRFAFAVLGLGLFVIGMALAVAFTSFWPLLLWLPAIVCGAVAAGMMG